MPGPGPRLRGLKFTTLLITNDHWLNEILEICMAIHQYVRLAVQTHTHTHTYTRSYNHQNNHINNVYFAYIQSITHHK